MHNDILYQQAVAYSLEHNFHKKFSEDLNKLKSDSFVLSQIEIDNLLPDTPTETGFVHDSDIPTTSISLLAYLYALNLYPVVYEGENNGHLIRHVVPRKGLEKQISSYGSNETFYPHVDNPDLQLRNEPLQRSIKTPSPDTLTLLCLRQHEGVATSILLLNDILTFLSEEEKQLLQDPVFSVSRPASFAGSHTTENLPLLIQQSDGSYISRFDYHNISTQYSHGHISALEKFKHISTDETIWKAFYLQPGQAVTFDNQKTLHTRNGFKPYFNGKDRWLLRVFGLYHKPSDCCLVPGSKHHLKTL
ncbi:TauD/TfdA family dioxygenase [Neisseria sp.]|uniref:TauD/TfdA family dioxygenase n=1 Tax=Neisseria sp. TaxID=192066 RepID=UPI0026DC22BE|nr:TauD/TfdA family dioxygenase [Neisseria sp.]MDO4906300.1 TauD/TfdA family dioxygenase [Neisseria sp.]